MPLSNFQIEDCTSISDNNSDELLSNILNLNLNNEAFEKTLITHINKLLSNAKTRGKGLALLTDILDNCSIETINTTSLNWVNYCIIVHADDSLREAKLQALAKIVEVSHTQTDFNKKFLSEFMPKVLNSCTNLRHVNNSYIVVALNTLTICIQSYPSWFGVQKNKIESYLTNLLDHSDEGIVEKAAIVFHNLQQVGNAGPDNINFRTNFTKNINKICNTIHKLFDKLFVNEREFYSADNNIDNDELFKFKEMDAYSSRQNVVLHLIRRINNCLKLLEVFIRLKFPAAKESKPKLLLAVICRGLTLHKCLTNDNDQSLESSCFSLRLNQIQIKLLYMLRLIIAWYKINILPFSYTVTKTLVDSLKRTHNCDCFQINCLYQEAAYKTLNEWLKITKNSLNAHFQEQVVTCILKDITPEKAEVTLNLSVNGPSKSAKAKRKVMNEQIISSLQDNSNHPNEKSLESTNSINRCKLALKSLETLLFYTELKLKDNTLHNLRSTILTTLGSIQISNAIHPYTNAQCIAALYEVLVAFCEQSIPPNQLTLTVLAKGINSHDRFIADICEKGLSGLEKVCQPWCPSLSVVNLNEILIVDDSLDGDIEENIDDIENEVEIKGKEQEIKQNSTNKTINILGVTIFNPSDNTLQNILNTKETTENGPNDSSDVNERATVVEENDQSDMPDIENTDVEANIDKLPNGNEESDSDEIEIIEIDDNDDEPAVVGHFKSPEDKTVELKEHSNDPNKLPVENNCGVQDVDDSQVKLEEQDASSVRDLEEEPPVKRVKLVVSDEKLVAGIAKEDASILEERVTEDIDGDDLVEISIDDIDNGSEDIDVVGDDSFVDEVKDD